MEGRVSYSDFINSNIRLVPNIGNIIPYNDLMEILFGNIITDMSKLELLNKKYLLERDGEHYFDLSRFEDYLLLALKRVDFHNKLCPINFYNCIDQLGHSYVIPEKLQKLFSVLVSFKNFLREKNDINAKIMEKLFWSNRFHGTIKSCHITPDIFMISIMFKRTNNFPLFLNFSDYGGPNGLLSLNQENDFEPIYQTWLQTLLMEDPDKYVISCLESITGSLDMATFIFKSHQNKDEYVINVNDLNNIIKFKNEGKLNEYMNEFKKMYADSNIYEENIYSLFLNFEGFNKYLLNLDIKYLINFSEKDAINTLYCNVMDELVNSYKKLYFFYKKT
tara:strand:+ start:838 stop:1839 length:1002 start_codon:yes stop_codon:yes gene_type:complete